MQLHISDIDAVLEDTLGLGGYDWLNEDTQLSKDLHFDLSDGVEFMFPFFSKFEIEPRDFNPERFFKGPPYKFPLWFSAFFVAVFCSSIAIGLSVIWIGLIIIALAFFADQFLVRHPRKPEMDISFRHLMAVAKLGYWVDADDLDTEYKLSS